MDAHHRENELFPLPPQHITNKQYTHFPTTKKHFEEQPVKTLRMPCYVITRTYRAYFSFSPRNVLKKQLSNEGLGHRVWHERWYIERFSLVIGKTIQGKKPRLKHALKAFKCCITTNLLLCEENESSRISQAWQGKIKHFFSFDSKKFHVIRLEIRPGKTSLQFCTRSRVSLPSYPMGVLSGGSVVVSRVAKNKGKIGLE